MTPLPSYEEATARLSPANYRTYLAGVALEEITLEAVEATINRAVADAAESLAFQILDGARLEAEDSERPALLLDWGIVVTTGRKQVCRLRTTYRLKLSVQQPVPLDFFAIYRRASAIAQVWPFFRELVHSTAGRMGLPALVLPLIKDPVAGPTDPAARPRRSTRSKQERAVPA